MGVRRGERIALVVRCAQEATVRVALEIEDPRGEHAASVQSGRHLGGDRAQVLPDDDRALPAAFQREDAEQVVGGKPDVRAFLAG